MTDDFIRELQAAWRVQPEAATATLQRYQLVEPFGIRLGVAVGIQSGHLPLQHLDAVLQYLGLQGLHHPRKPLGKIEAPVLVRWHGSLPKDHEGRKRGQGEYDRGDPERHRHERGRFMALRLRPADVGEAAAQSQQTAEVAEPPSVAGNPAHLVFRGNLRQKGRNQILPGTEHDNRQNEQDHR